MSGPDGLDSTGNDRTSWSNKETSDGGPEFVRMIESLRLLQARMTGADLPPELMTEAANTFEKLADEFDPHTVSEEHQVVGHQTDLPGRGQALVPPLHVDQWDEQSASGHFTLSRFYLGGGGAAHGGVVPLMFDEILGRLANTARLPSRTAYLHVNFRKITPIGIRLRVQARVQRVEGRKRFLHAEIYHDGAVTADAEGLFVQLRPGQP